MTAQPCDLPAVAPATHLELTVVREVPFTARCRAHELPYFGVAHVGYVPGMRPLDVADLADALERLTREPQRQERLTAALSDWIDATLDPLGVGVIVEAEHTCHADRGPGGRGARVVIARFRGVLQSNPMLRAEFVGRGAPRRQRTVRAVG